jgi:hypothetical protein
MNIASPRRAALAFLAVAILASIFPATAASQSSTLVTLAKIREAWVQNLGTKELEPILKSYAPDAVFLQPSGERISGSAALRTLFQSIMATFDSDLTLPSTARTSKHRAISLTTVATFRNPNRNRHRR